MICRKDVFMGDGSFTNNNLNNPDIRQRLDVVYAEIRSLYLSGAPLFSREVIQDVSQQLGKLEGKCGKVSVRAFNGVMVEFAVQTGRILPWGGADTEYIIGAPFMHFCSIQELTSIDLSPVERIAYCSLRIYHYGAFRNKYTKQILDIDTNGQLMDDKGDGDLRDTKDVFKSNQQHWEESEQCKKLESIVQSINFSVDIRQIIAFACGSISYDFDQEAPRSSFQHALALTLCYILTERRKDLGSTSCYAQDPAYSEVDISILREYGITVLENPEGFLKIDESTLVISCAADVPIRQIVLELVRPAAMVWDRIKGPDADMVRTDPDSSRTWEMILRYYDVFEIPGGTENFGDVALYVRRPADSSTI